MSEDKDKNGTDGAKITISNVNIKPRDLIQWVVLLGGFGFFGAQLPGQDKSSDPNEGPVIRSEFKAYVKTQEEHRKMMKEQLEELKKKTTFLFEQEVERYRLKKKPMYQIK